MPDPVTCDVPMTASLPSPMNSSVTCAKGGGVTRIVEVGGARPRGLTLLTQRFVMPLLAAMQDQL
jgi:hypothetical protein